ncbi:MAG: PilZ domain-containing protein [Candidatus Omnitrophota bacterium]
MVERRHHERFDAAIEVRYKVVSQGGEANTRSRNVSEEGLCLILNRELKKGMTVELEFMSIEKSGENPIKINGVVIWSREVGIFGDEFTLPAKGLARKKWKYPLATLKGEEVSSLQNCYKTGIRLTKEQARLVTKLLGAFSDAERKSEKEGPKKKDSGEVKQ